MTKIPPVPEGEQRPVWSVMIPTYNCARFLGQTLESVLAQDPGPERMQIEVVDDCSPGDNPEEVVRSICGDRVNFYRKPANEGAIANFNTCIARARGRLVHILHGDDFVRPGFHAAMERLSLEKPEVALLGCRSFVVNADGSIEWMSERCRQLEQGSSDSRLLWHTNFLRTPAVVVRRDFYEHHGGFHPALIHCADWEMWIRAIALGGGAMINEPLACYRSFPENDTGRLAQSGANLRDWIRMGEILDGYLPDFEMPTVRRAVAREALVQAQRFKATGNLNAAALNLGIWRELSTPRQRIAAAADWARHRVDRLLGEE